MSIFACPFCHYSLNLINSKNKKILKCTKIDCNLNNKVFNFIDNIPVIVPFNEEKCLLDKNKLFKKNLGTDKRILNKQLLRIQKIIKFIFQGTNVKSLNNFSYLSKKLNPKSKVLIIGGGSKGDGMNKFYRHCKKNNISIDSIDIYLSKNITAIADAHYLPYKNSQFDIVIIQAVLEHVLDPKKVVDESLRVLKKFGLIYAETPFMQSVHEGAYDFSRFSHSGHRWLFKEFKEIKSGYNQGAFTAFLFIGSYAISGLTRSKILGLIIRLIFTRIAKFFDSITSKSHNIDVACGNYFLGQKINSYKKKSAKWIIKYYSGSQL